MFNGMIAGAGASRTNCLPRKQSTVCAFSLENALAPTEIEIILSGPDYFTCKRLRAILAKTACVKRQTEKSPAASANPEAESEYLCFDCAQGAEIAREMGKTVPKRKPAKLCTAPGCNNRRKYRELCGTCYQAWRYGRKPELGPFVRVRPW